MSTQPLGSPRFQSFDSNGNPLSGGLLYTYSAGTTTPLSTYTTRDGGIANANPVVLDSQGYADVWMQPGVLYKFVLKDSGGSTLWTVDNFPSPSDSSASTDDVTVDPGGRVSINSSPVPNSDHTSQTTIFYVPYKSDRVPLYNGTAWALYSIGTGISQTTSDATKSPAAVAANKNYDLFVWNDSGVIRLSRGPFWTSDTARGTGAGTTELVQVNGRWVNNVSISNGPAANFGLYVGTIRSDGSSQLNDSMTLRHVWNMYNRAIRPMSRLEATSSWAYTTAAWRQANGSASNQISMVIGLSEDAVSARVVHSANTNNSNTLATAGIGLDSTSAPASACITATAYVSLTVIAGLVSFWKGFPNIGYHYLSWLEYGGASVFFFGANGQIQTGIQGEILG